MLLHNLAIALVLSLSLSGCGSSNSDGGDGNNKPQPPADEQRPTTEPPPAEENKPPEVNPDSDDKPNATVFSLTEGTISKKGHFVAKLDWLSNLKAETFVHAQISFATKNRQKPRSVKNIIFDPQMPSMGHGTSTEDQRMTQDNELTYVFKVDDIYFIMGGQWEIRVTATVDDVDDMATFPVEVP